MKKDFVINEKVLCPDRHGPELGRVLDVMQKMCLVKFDGHKAEWIQKDDLIHYTTGDD